jgi:hypothetical protein
VQALADVHDTPASRLYLWPAWFGVGWIVQLVPSQLSAKVRSLPALLYDPTAVQALAEVQDTPDSWLFNVGFGVDWIAQLLPSQLSAKV